MLKWYREAVRERYRDPATRRYVARLLATMTLYVVLLAIVQRAAPLDHMRGLARQGLAALPGLPIAAVFWLLGRYIVEIRDEYQRLLEVRKALIATGITMTIVSIWGFEEMLAGAPHLPAFYIPLIWFGSFGVGECINRFVERDRT